MKMINRIAAAVCSAALAASVSAVAPSAAQGKTWEELYASMLRKEIGSPSEYPDGFDAFSVFDIDSDGTPELILSQGDYHGAGCTIYTVSGGKTVKVGEVGSYGECACVPSKKYVVSSYMGMGYTTIAYYEMNGTELTQIIQFDDNAGVAEDSEEITYTIDGEEVTAAEYDAKYDEMHIDSSISLGRTFPLTENSTEYAVAGVKDCKTAYSRLLTDRCINIRDQDISDRFTLMNITGDSTPELILRHYDISYIYTFTDGKVRLMTEEFLYPVSGKKPDFTYRYSASKKIFMIKVASPKDKGYAYAFYSTKGNGLTRVAVLQRGKDYDGRYTYRVDNKVISASAYNKALKKYTGIRYGSAAKMYKANEKNIKKVLG